MEKSVNNRNINVICPEVLKSFIVESHFFKHPHFMDLEQVEKAAFEDCSKEDVVLYASYKKKKDPRYSYVTAKKDMNQFLLLKDKPSKEVPSPILDLFTKCKECKDSGFFKGKNELDAYILKKYPIYIIGYPSNHSALLSAFKVLGIMKYTFLSQEDLNLPKNNYSVHVFSDAIQEVFYGLSNMRYKLYGDKNNKESKENIDIREYAILCPTSYNTLLKNAAPLFKLHLDICDLKVNEVPLIRDWINNDFPHSDFNTFLTKIGENISLSEYTSKLAEALTSIKYIQKKDKDIDSKLLKEYLNSLLSGCVVSNDGYTGIPVYNTIEQVRHCKYLLILGFSDDLISSAKDNGLIPDSLKDFCNYQETSVIKNEVTEQITKFLFTFIGDVSISRSKISQFKEYSNVFFVKDLDDKSTKSYWIKEDININPYFEYQEKMTEEKAKKESKSLDLVFLSSYFQNRFDAINDVSHLLLEIKEKKPQYLENYGSYNPSFDSDEKTNKYFHDFFANKTIDWSYSRLTPYLTNPFLYFVKHILNLKPRTPNSLAAAIGTLVHSYLEQRGHNFKLKEEKKDVLNKNKNNLGSISLEEADFFLDQAIGQAEKMILPYLKQMEKDCHIKFVKPINPQNKAHIHEFSFDKVDIGNNVTITGSYDAIYENQNNNAIIVDFKTGKDLDKYYKFSNVLGHEGLQLPFYVFAFPYVKKQKQYKNELKQYKKVDGAYVCYALPPDGLIIKKNIMKGFRLSDTPLDSRDVKQKWVKEDMLLLVGKDKKEKLENYQNILDKWIKIGDLKPTELGYKPDGFFLKDDGKLDFSSREKLIVNIAGLMVIKSTDSLKNGVKLENENISYFPNMPAFVKVGSTLKDIQEDDITDLTFQKDEDVKNGIVVVN